MRRPIARFAALFLVSTLLGCGSEDRLTGTPKNLPPGTMPPAPPLGQTPAELARIRKSGKKVATPKAINPVPSPAS
ncbi:hypothetical protein EP7_000220 [Isosphaeraceae bacterium EP7]